MVQKLSHKHLPVSKKVKEVDLYSAFIVVPHTQGAQVRITQFYLQITPYLPLPNDDDEFNKRRTKLNLNRHIVFTRKHSPDGASPDLGCGHLIAAYYSFIYPKKDERLSPTVTTNCIQQTDNSQFVSQSQQWPQSRGALPQREI